MESTSKRELSFEEALSGLETAAELLQKEGTTLEEALRSFEEGMEYHARCTELLETARQRILRYDRTGGGLSDF